MKTHIWTSRTTVLHSHVFIMFRSSMCNDLVMNRAVHYMLVCKLECFSTAFPLHRTKLPLSTSDLHSECVRASVCIYVCGCVYMLYVVVEANGNI